MLFSFRSFRSHRGATCRLGSRQGKGAPRQFRDATWIPVFPDIRRDIPDTYELPLPLFEYFLNQAGGQVWGRFRRDAATIAVFARRRLSANVDTGTGSSRGLEETQCPGVRLRRGSGGAAEFCAGHALWGCPLDSERRCRPSRALLDLKVSQASTVCRQLRQFPKPATSKCVSSASA